MHKPHHVAEKFLGVSYDALDERAQKVARHVAQRKHIARNTTKEQDEAITRASGRPMRWRGSGDPGPSSRCSVPRWSRAWPSILSS